HGRARAKAPGGRSWSSWLKGARPRRASGPAARAASFLLVTDEAPADPAADEEMVTVPLAALRDGETAEARQATRTARRIPDEPLGELESSPGVHEAFTHRGVAFYDLCAGDLQQLLQVALPRAVHLFEQMASLLRTASPQAVAVRAASRDERRTLLAAC